MANVRDFEICETLCYIQNNYDKATKQGLTTTVSGFYTIDEIVKAKEKIFAIVESLHDNGVLPPEIKRRNVVRKFNDKKKRQDTEDMLMVYAELDVAKVRLPVFVAADLQRIPPFSPDATDFCTLAFNVSELQSRLAVLEQRNSGWHGDNKSSCNDGKATAATVNDNIVVDVDSIHGDKIWSTDKISWADTASKNMDEWTVVNNARHQYKQKPKPDIKVKGTKSIDGHTDDSVMITAVPRKPVLTAFVGRLHIDTTEEQLTNYLQAEGIRGACCRKLKARDGRTFTTAAFRVTCLPESEDLFYSEDCWPEGAEIRDWIFYRNNNGSRS